MDYKKLLIQQQTYDGTTHRKVGVTVDTQNMFGVVCQEFPFKYLPETKELPKREWYDEDGEDVYVPSDGMKYAAYDLEVKFLYVGTEEKMSANLKDFVDYICGRINYIRSYHSTVKVDASTSTKNVVLDVYDEYTKTGRRGLYVKEVGNDLFAYDDVNENVIGVFKVKFRVTEPTSEVTLTEGV